MNSLNFFKIFRIFSKYKHTPNINLLKCTAKSFPFKNSLSPLFLFSWINPKLDRVETKKEEIIPINHTSEIKKECLSSEKKINELIKSLETAITETCEKYRVCIKKQIDILENGATIDPLDKYWDSLVPLRIETDTLKKDFESYRSMVEYVGQLAYNLAFCAALISNLDSKDYVCNEYCELEKIAKEQITENKKVEEELLEKSMQNILSTTYPTKDVKDVTANIKKKKFKYNTEKKKNKNVL